MSETTFDLNAYLERIGVERLPANLIEKLHALHRAQAYAIPFEVFDIHLGRGISVAPAESFHKLVGKRRGGYCYELNTLLGDALEAAGFEVQRLLARVLFKRESPGPRTHMVLVVTAEGKRWLADVGFGGPGIVDPLPLEPGRESEQAGARFRLREDARYGHVLERGDANGWAPLYAFNFESFTSDDVVVANHFTSTHPSSPFRGIRMCALPSPTGRATLANFELSLHRHDGTSQTRTIEPGVPYLQMLQESFGLILDADYEDLAPLK